MKPRTRTLLLLAPALVLLLVAWVDPLVAQEALPGSDLGSQSMRPYRFVFYAYGLAWILVLGWVISVARRVNSLTNRLDS